MSGTTPRRVAIVLAALAAGAAIGLVVGSTYGGPVVGGLAGAALGVALIATIDARRGDQLLRWLRGGQHDAAPRDTGFWGEVGYRAERALRQRERALDEERRRLDQILSALEASPNGVLLLDRRGQIDWCNRVAADHFGLDPERDRGQRITNLVRAPAFKAYLNEACFDEPVGFEAPQGQTSLSVTVRPYGEGRMLVLSQDVTERERSEAMRRDFVANVSHEIRTPLTVLAGFVETMASLPLSESERQRVLLLMDQQTTRMQDLVADLLTLAQLEGSPRPQADRWVPMTDLLQRAEAEARALSAGRHTLEVDIGAAVEVAGVDAELHSAIGNLLSNAVRYTPTGGRIALAWTLRADGAGVVEVCDSGIGVAREHLPRLTERFYRVDSSRARNTGGTGLGLSIVKHVMQRHGGSIEVDSESGQGSRFRLIFPSARVRAMPAPIVTAPNAAIPT
ncbi:MAG: phosphate regulon sensor histidine kinase PhoR [Rubrivivax sp.]